MHTFRFLYTTMFLWFYQPFRIEQPVRYIMHQRVVDIWFNRVISYKPLLQPTSLFLKTKCVIHLRQRSTVAITARWCNVKSNFLEPIYLSLLSSCILGYSACIIFSNCCVKTDSKKYLPTKNFRISPYWIGWEDPEHWTCSKTTQYKVEVLCHHFHKHDGLWIFLHECFPSPIMEPLL